MYDFPCHFSRLVELGTDSARFTVSPELSALINKLQEVRSLSNLKLYHYKGTNSGYVFFASEQEPFIRGGVYKEDGKYIILSPTCKNNKYRKYDIDHYKTKTKDPNRAYKLAIEHLQFSVQTMLSMSESLRSYFSTWEGRELRGNRDDLDEKYRGLFHTPTYSRSMASRVPPGVEMFLRLVKGLPISEEEETQALDLVESFENYKRKAEEPLENYEVYLFQRSAVVMGHATRKYKEFSLENLPEEVKGSVAALQLLEQGNYVDELGVKVNPRVFFLTKKPGQVTLTSE